VRKEHYQRFHPPLVGWHSASSPNFIAQESLVFKADARRYEPGSLNLAGIIGLRAALQLIFECGVEAVETRVLALARQATADATQAGFTVVGPATGPGVSGIVSMSSTRLDMARLHKNLEAAGIVTSLRYLRDGRKCLRLSPHFYNQEKEVADAIGRIHSGGNRARKTLKTRGKRKGVWR
jgi:selenocysteine lyase/cysteine desulfurase